MTVAEMIASIRRVVRDDRYVVNQFNLTCIAEDASSALLSIVNGQLTTVITGSGAAALTINLSSTLYDTVGKLHNYLSKQEGYNCTQLQGMSEDSPSVGLEPNDLIEIKEVGFDLRTRMFSDMEYEGFLRRAMTRHNPSMTLEQLPQREEHLVLTLCQADLMRTLANDAVRRKNLDMTMDDLLKLAAQYEKVYADDAKRLGRVITTPTETTDEVGSGDIMVGDFTRANARLGYRFPITSSLLYDNPIEFLPITEMTIEDTRVLLRWTRKRNAAFYRVEVWRDTRPDVRRRETNPRTGTPTTSKLVYSDGSSLRDTFVDEHLEPEQDYYYRIYLVDTSGEWRETEVLKVTTKPLRAMFLQPAITPKTNVAGGPYTLKLSSYAEGEVEIQLGGKVISGGEWVPEDGTLTITDVPAFINKGMKDLTITGNGMVHFVPNAFRVT